MNTYCAILCGGDGKRLWPTSRKSFPKQFLPLVGGLSLFQLAFKRALRTSLPEHILLVTIDAYKHNALKQARELIPGFPEENLIIKPDSKDTFAVIACALAVMHDREASPSDVLICAPSDHLIHDERGYGETMQRAIKAAKDGLVVIGITPDSPSGDYGYIEASPVEDLTLGSPVLRFTEKPTVERAKEYLAKGNFFWNAGMYTGSLNAFMNEIRQHEPHSAMIIEKGLQAACANFDDLAEKSIDYCIAEKTHNLRVIPSAFDWSDLGSHSALIPVHNTEMGDEHRHVAFNTENTLVDARGKLVVTLGVKDLTIVDVNDVLLVMERSQESQLPQVLKTLREQGHSEVDHHYRGYRPWGNYEVLERSPKFLVKKLNISPGCSSQIQTHAGRAEHWTIVTGVARVLINDEARLLHTHESLHIPAGTKHSIANPSTEPLVVLEIQTGDLDEDNVTRYTK